jgi:hypothetical protein
MQVTPNQKQKLNQCQRREVEVVHREHAPTRMPTRERAARAIRTIRNGLLARNAKNGDVYPLTSLLLAYRTFGIAA